MEQEKIGKFIAKLRREKNMTQIDLADKLGITDRAISKWVNGRGMPDLSLMKQLCDELGITVNELLSGEKLDKRDYQERLEENIINTIDYTNKKIKKTKKIYLIILLVVLIFISIFIALFAIDINRMLNNKPVLFSTWGFSYIPPIDLKEEEIKIAIKDYLIEKSDNEPTHHESEKGFVSIKIYLIEENNLYYNVYAWVLEEKYYLKNNEINKDSVSSIPYKFIVKYIDDEYVVTDSIIPRDGSLYDKDMKNIFPYWVRKDMDDIYIDGTIERLQLDIKEQVKLYFHK